MSIADVVAAFLAFGLLHLRGHLGYAGWRWLFLIEGILTFVIVVVSIVFMPPSPTQIASTLRGKKGWFTEQEEVIMVNCVIREDPTKSYMHNRQPITPKLLWKSMTDYDLWPLYILEDLDTFHTSLLVIPSVVFHMFTMMALTYVAEIWKELNFTAAIPQTSYAIMTALLSYPSAHPIQVAWNSRISNSVRSRTVSAALYNMFVQTSGIIISNIYRKDDAPLYKRGNKALLSICVTNLFIYSSVKLYYVQRNKQRYAKWQALTEDQKIEYLSTTTDEGNIRLDFRFAH